MPSGASGMVRYRVSAVGFVVLGSIVFARISSSLLIELPDISASQWIGLIGHIAAGHYSGALAGVVPQAALQALAMRSFGDGFRATLIAATAFLQKSTRYWPSSLFGAELRQPESQEAALGSAIGSHGRISK